MRWGSWVSFRGAIRPNVCTPSNFRLQSAADVSTSHASIAFEPQNSHFYVVSSVMIGISESGRVCRRLEPYNVWCSRVRAKSMLRYSCGMARGWAHSVCMISSGEGATLRYATPFRPFVGKCKFYRTETHFFTPCNLFFSRWKEA